MKVIILAGGLGTRISEESVLKPKPLIELGEKPILWHIMKIYSHFGYHDFGICLGYRGYLIKEYFANYFLHNSNVTFDFRGKETKLIIHSHQVEKWQVTLVDTGANTMTGGRVKRMKEFVGGERFMLTYGDGVGDVDINALLKFHESHGKLCTVTAVQPTGRFGVMDVDSQDFVKGFVEKPKGDAAWVNAGFFIMEPEVLDFISGDETILERDPLERLTRQQQLVAYRHSGFWHPMDTMRDKHLLEDLWHKKEAPWKLWEDEKSTAFTTTHQLQIANA